MLPALLPSARSARLALVALAVSLAAAPAASAADDRPWHVLERPIDPAQLTDLPFGDRSHWLQPWRASLNTRPASALAGAAGINLNVEPAEIARTASTLAAAGVRRVRVEIGWNHMSYADPSVLETEPYVREGLRALRAASVRPLILLNSTESAPVPMRRDRLTVTRTAWAGARQVTLDAASAAKVVPGRTGFDAGTLAGGLVITKLSGTTATLSQPLPLAVILPGSYGASTFRYAPFAPPRTTTGEPNPLFEETMDGWLRYVRAVTRTAADVLGGDGFDVEVWNELSVGSGFLDPKRYHNPVPAEMQGTGSVTDEILARTAAALRDPANGTPGIGIGNGFANQTPFASPADLPPGVTALDKHPYRGLLRLPAHPTSDKKIRTVGADGKVFGKRQANGDWQEGYGPKYDAFLPEYFLTGIQTETLMRDLAPITTTVSGRPHGRNVPTADGRPAEVWITETGMDPANTGLSGAAADRMQAKATLRGLVSYVSAGADLVSFYTAKGHRPWALIPDAFFRSTRSGADAAGDASLVGPTLPALGRLLRAVGDADARGRQLELHAIADQHDRKQFTGSSPNSASAPDLHDRDVVTFFPFQQGPNRFAVATYVMTRSLATAHRPELATSDPRRYDMAPAIFRLRVGGVVADRVRVGLYDPLDDETATAEVVERDGDEVTVELPLTDTPRILTIDDGPAAG